MGKHKRERKHSSESEKEIRKKISRLEKKLEARGKKSAPQADSGKIWRHDLDMTSHARAFWRHALSLMRHVRAFWTSKFCTKEAITTSATDNHCIFLDGSHRDQNIPANNQCVTASDYADFPSLSDAASRAIPCPLQTIALGYYNGGRCSFRRLVRRFQNARFRNRGSLGRGSGQK